MKTRWEIILAGAGGQGLALGAELLAKAVMLGEDWYMAQNQSYDARARGGDSQAELIISREEILYPIVTCADLLLALTPGAYAKSQGLISESGITVYDSSGSITPVNRGKEYGFPFNTESIAIENSKGITIMALGASNELLQIIPPENFIRTMEDRFKGAILEANIKSFNRGRSLVTG